MKAKHFTKSHPLCCFCSGKEPASTIEHLPAKIIFPKKHRPRGLEFPACVGCNDQTRGDDSVLAVFARALGSMRSGTRLIDDNVLARAAAGARRNFPDFKLTGRQELQMVNGVVRKVVVFDGSHPIIHLCLCRLAAKFALAQFYKLSNSIADESYRINTMWTHNQHSEAGEVGEILKMFPDSSSLKQGRWDTADTFYFRHVFKESTLITAAVFYETILLYAHLGPCDDAKHWAPMQKTWGAGRKKGPSGDALEFVSELRRNSGYSLSGRQEE